MFNFHCSLLPLYICLEQTLNKYTQNKVFKQTNDYTNKYIYNLYMYILYLFFKTVYISIAKLLPVCINNVEINDA